MATPAPPQSEWRRAWSRFRKNRLALAGGIVVVLLVLVALLAPLVAPHNPNQPFDDGLTMQGLPVPSTLFHSAEFLLGTDQNGRDLLSRIIFGARVSLAVAIVANTIALLVGLLIGAVAGYKGGATAQVLMRFTDMVMAFPTLLLAIALVAILRPSLWVIMGVIGAVYWTGIARVIYGETRRLRENVYVEAARSVGAPTAHIIVRHIVPHLVPTLIVWFTLGVATNVMIAASLSYLGIGVQPPTASWGGMIRQGQSFYRTAPWLIVYPGIAIMISVLSFNLLGDGLRDALDPKHTE